MLCHRPTTNEAGLADIHVSVEDSSGRNVAMIADLRIVLYQSPAVNDAIASDFGIGIDHGTIHDDASRTNGCMSGYMSKRRNDDGHFKSGRAGLTIEAKSAFAGFNLAYRYQRTAVFLGQLTQGVICCDDFIPA